MCLSGETEVAPLHGLIPTGICKGPLVCPYDSILNRSESDSVVSDTWGYWYHYLHGKKSVKATVIKIGDMRCLA